jgi:GT2 family glycosyltransferase
MPESTRLTVIIITWNSIDYIDKCLAALYRQTFKDFQLHVVDNASNDGSADFIVTHFPEVHLRKLPHNIGFAAANNLALKEVKTEYVALLNPDAFAHPDWLNNLLTAMDEYPEAGFAASKMLLFDQPDFIDRAGDAYTRAGTASLRGRGKASNQYNSFEWVFGASAGAALYRREMLENIGLFNERFFLLYEDVDLSFRAQLSGYRCLYVPNAVVHHIGSQSIGKDSWTSIYFSHRNLEWVYFQNMPTGPLLRTLFVHLVYIFGSFLFFTIKGHGLTYLKAKWHALRGMKVAFTKRRMIQLNRKVSDKYIWDLLEKELFLPRLKRRME